MGYDKKILFTEQDIEDYFNSIPKPYSTLFYESQTPTVKKMINEKIREEKIKCNKEYKK